MGAMFVDGDQDLTPAQTGVVMRAIGDPWRPTVVVILQPWQPMVQVAIADKLPTSGIEDMAGRAEPAPTSLIFVVALEHTMSRISGLAGGGES